MTPKLIALDLDGTLLNQESQLSQTTIETIQAVQEKGHRVVIATGRPYRMAHGFYKQLQLETPMINFNGSLIHRPGKVWEGEKNFLIDKSYLIDFLTMEDQLQADFIAGEYKHHFYITQDHIDAFDPRLMGVDEITPDTRLQIDKITKDPHSILLQTRRQDKYDLAEEIKERFHHTIEVNTWGGPLNVLETCAKGISKATALEYLLDYYQMERKDLIAFGDETNDTEMLAFAGTGFAMKNANPDILSVADRMTDFSNEDDGVARQLQDLFL